MHSDTLKAKQRSWFRHNQYAQAYCTDFNWKRAYPMEKNSDTPKTLRKVFQDVGVPHTIVVDNAREQVQGEYKKLASTYGSRIKPTLPYSPWQQKAEGAIKELKRGTLRKQSAAHSPTKLWDHCIELEAHIQSRTASGHPALEGQVPETMMTGHTADVSPYVEHRWYDWVKAYAHNTKYPHDKEILGRWLGPARDVGPAMCSKIL